MSTAIPATSSQHKEHHMKNATQQQPVAAAISAISQQQHEAASTCGSRWGKNRQERIEIATDYSRMLGAEPTFLEWEAARTDWVNGYTAANPGNTGNAADAAWADFSKLLNDLFGLVKPKSKSDAAVKKGKERSAKEQALFDKYKDKGVADLQGMRRAALEKAAAGSDLAEKIAAEIKKVLRVKTRDQDKAIAEERTALRQQVRAAASKCTDLEKLQAALDILDVETELSFIDEDIDA
jgi:hypothetical protein